MRFVRENSGLTAPQIYKQIDIPRSHYSNIVKHNRGGLVPAKRLILTELVNSTKVKMGQKPGPKQLSFEFQVGEKVDLTSPQINVNVTRKAETVWMVEVKLTEGQSK